jgi:hypothetical protein
MRMMKTWPKVSDGDSAVITLHSIDIKRQFTVLIMPRKVKKSDHKLEHGDEIALRLDGALITPEEFRKAVSAFVDLLLQISEEIAEGGKKPLWKMSVRTGSSVFVARPVPDIETQKSAKDAIKCLRSGMTMLDKGQRNVPHFSNKALQAASSLASLRAKQGISVIEITSSGGKPVTVREGIVDVVSKTIGSQKQEYGSVEGKLSTISERGGFQFVVWDVLADRPINCFVPENKFQEAYAAFRKRVRVSGMVQHDREGKPVSIKVDDIRVFRDLSHLPPIEHYIGILKPA